ncbi:MAG TPA: NUDIX hydrolase, partial [Ornithinibacter sp.]|nr:NUDIX hydrolase [Ornithinibacter sp.]
MPSGSVRRGPRDVVSAGVVVFGPKRTVLLVHRPKYDDWSFPKGKLDPGERAAAAAVREVLEETGVRVRLGPPLASQRYPVRGGMKTVVYWTGRPVDDTPDNIDVSTYAPNAEIDKVVWVSIPRARGLLTYEHDVETLDEALQVRKRTRTFVVLRHGISRARKSWHGDDRRRPLVAGGF